MSLQHLAQEMQSRGRGDDSVLVHMTPQEVNGLQALAMAHGGSLTINPETGLPEASFLSKILPMIAGVALAPLTAGTSLAWMGTPMGAALTVGGLTGLATGSLNKGLMAGLGAFGGAGFGQGLMTTGANAATTNAANAIQQAPIFPANTTASAAAPSLDTLKYQAITGTTPTYTDVVPAANLGSQTFPSTLNAPSGFDAFKGGFQAIGANPVEGLKSVWENMPTGTGIASIGSLANAARPDYQAPKQSKSLIRPYRLDRRYEQSGIGDTGYGTSERRYFDYAFTPQTPYEAPGPEYAASGGLMGLASFDDGGYVRYTGTRPLDEYKDDYYYVGGMDPHYMYKPQYGPGSGSPSGEYDTSQGTGPYKYDYDRATGKFTQKAGPGTPAPTSATPDATAQQNAMITNMFQKYLGRAPEQDALDYYKQTSQDQLAKDIMGSKEYKENLTRPLNRNVINAAYQDILRRDVDEPGFQNYAVAGMTPDQLRNELMKSSEYQARQEQLVNRDQADQLYQQMLGRSIDPEGLKSYVDAKNMTADELKNALMQSNEYKKREASFATATQAANAFEDILGRKIDPEALKFYTQQQRMTPAELQKTLMSSDEYLTNLTKPFVPAPQVNKETGQVSIEGALRTPQQEAARPQNMTNFYAMMNQRLAEQAQRQGYASGGPVEMMSAMNAAGANVSYPQALLQTSTYSNPTIQRPLQTKVLSHGLDTPVDPYTGEERFAGGGLSDLGAYSDGGRLLKGPGDGVSDSIPAVIGQRQPARLADGEFVVPARIVSELGNGSTEAGARKLYAMMDRVQKARKKSVGKGRVAANTKADRHLPA